MKKLLALFFSLTLASSVVAMTTESGSKIVEMYIALCEAAAAQGEEFNGGPQLQEIVAAYVDVQQFIQIAQFSPSAAQQIVRYAETFERIANHVTPRELALIAQHSYDVASMLITSAQLDANFASVITLDEFIDIVNVSPRLSWILAYGPALNKSFSERLTIKDLIRFAHADKSVGQMLMNKTLYARLAPEVTPEAIIEIATHAEYVAQSLLVNSAEIRHTLACSIIIDDIVVLSKLSKYAARALIDDDLIVEVLANEIFPQHIEAIAEHFPENALVLARKPQVIKSLEPRTTSGVDELLRRLHLIDDKIRPIITAHQYGLKNADDYHLTTQILIGEMFIKTQMSFNVVCGSMPELNKLQLFSTIGRMYLDSMNGMDFPEELIDLVAVQLMPKTESCSKAARRDALDVKFLETIEAKNKAAFDGLRERVKNMFSTSNGAKVSQSTSLLAVFENAMVSFFINSVLQRIDYESFKHLPVDAGEVKDLDSSALQTSISILNDMDELLRKATEEELGLNHQG